MTQPLTFVQGDTGPNPLLHVQRVSPTAGATARDLSSVATAFIRWAQTGSSPATTYVVPATIASGATPPAGLIEGLMASLPAALASSGRYEMQLVLRGPWGVETWPRDEPYPVTIIPRMGAL